MLETHLSDSHTEWGVYTTKSGYWSLINENKEKKEAIWSILWKLNIPLSGIFCLEVVKGNNFGHV